VTGVVIVFGVTLATLVGPPVFVLISDRPKQVSDRA
jgi:hypothetical protein